ncbi:MAG: hypothetical protein M3461_06955 [Pseudomonadota bacterium]|nr:hypothetical protein [Pseudomonadota bacterium]
MKRLTSAIAALLLALAVLASSGAFAGSVATAGRAHGAGHAHGFERFLQRYEAANSAFVNGDPSPWLSITAQKDPASIFGGFGGLGEAGVAEVRQRYLLAASAFRPSGAQVDFEYLVKETCAAGWLTPWRSSAPTSCTRGRTRYSSRSCGPR